MMKFLFILFIIKRVTVCADGHFLPRVVFRRCKNKDILPQYLTYEALFSTAAASGQEN